MKSQYVLVAVRLVLMGSAFTPRHGRCQVDVTPPVIHCPGDITRYICGGGSVRIIYIASATDDFPGDVSLSYDPPNPHFFTPGTTTPVTVTATDQAGNTNTCTFTVKVVDTSFWQTIPSGQQDCFAPPTEPVTRSACLNSAYPSADWRPYDDVSIDRPFGQSWLNLPAGLLNAKLTAVLRPCLVKKKINRGYIIYGEPENDSISLGLEVCSPAQWHWSRFIGSGNPSAGLLSQQWRGQTGCGVTFNFSLANLPTDISLLPLINSARRFDMYIQDDTAVDYASLSVLRCPPPNVFSGVGVESDDAIPVHGWNTWNLVPDPDVGGTNFTVKLNLGEALGFKAGLTTAALNQTSNGVATVQLATVMPDASEKSFGLALMVSNGTNGTFLRFQPTASAPVSHGQLKLRLQGVQVASPTNGPGLLPAPVTLPLTEFESIAFSRGSNLVLRLASAAQFNGAFGSVTADELDFSIAGDPDWLGGALPRYFEIAANNVPELGLHDLAVELDGQYQTAGDTALAQVNGNQLVLSPFDATSDEPVVARLSTPATNEFRAWFGFPFIAPPATNASLSLITRGVTGGVERDLPALHYDNTGSAWSLTAFIDGSPAPFTRVQLWNSGALLADFSNPTNVLVSALPAIHWPRVTGSVDGDVSHGFPYRAATDVFINGVAYSITELRVLTATNGQPVEALTGERIEAVKPDVLALGPLGAGPEKYRLEPLEVGDNITIRWSGLGGVLERAFELDGPWVPVVNGVGGEVALPDDNAPAAFFRVRSE